MCFSPGTTVFANAPPNIKLEESQESKLSLVINQGTATSGAVTTTTEEEEEEEEEEMEVESIATIDTSMDTSQMEHTEPDLGPMSPGEEVIYSLHELHETCHSVTFIVLVNSHLR